MDAEIKQRWIAALRGRRYKQGRSYLSHTDRSNTQRFCCLGVLCDVLQVPYTEKQGDNYVVRLYGSNQDCCYLPHEVTEALGITKECNVPLRVVEKVLKQHSKSKQINLRGRRRVSLADVNDYLISFDTIADIIEEAL